MHKSILNTLIFAKRRHAVAPRNIVSSRIVALMYRPIVKTKTSVVAFLLEPNVKRHSERFCYNSIARRCFEDAKLFSKEPRLRNVHEISSCSYNS